MRGKRPEIIIIDDPYAGEPARPLIKRSEINRINAIPGCLAVVPASLVDEDVPK